MRPEPSHSSQPLRSPHLPLIHSKVVRNLMPERLLYQLFEVIAVASQPLMRALEYGDSVRQMERLEDAALRQRPPLVQSEERATWRDSTRRNLDRRGFILDYNRDVIHPASESRRNVAECSFHNLIEICCAHCVVNPNTGSSGIVAKNHAAEFNIGDAAVLIFRAGAIICGAEP